MFKRITAVAMSCMLLISTILPAHATTISSGKNTSFNVESARQSIYQQLEAQNALDLMDEFERLLLPADESTVMPCGDEDEYQYRYAPYGGTVSYVYTEGYETYEVQITHLDYDNSYYYILNQSTYSGEDLLMDLLGFVPYVSEALFFAAQLENVVTQAARNSIIAANGYAKITTMYSRVAQSTAVVLSGWDDYPCMYVRVPNATNVVFTIFEEHDPWA